MRLITKNTDYAIRALLGLASADGGFVSAKEISRVHAIPYQFLRRILNALIAAKLVVSREGARGGFRLAVPPGDVKVLDVMRIMQGDLCLSECMFRRRICRNRPTCVLRREIVRIEQVVAREFEGLTIASLLTQLRKK